MFKKEVKLSIKNTLKYIFGDIKDEYGEDYEEVYKYEFNRMISDINDYLMELKDNEIEIKMEQLSGALQFRWSCTFGLKVEDTKAFEIMAKLILKSIDKEKEGGFK